MPEVILTWPKISEGAQSEIALVQIRLDPVLTKNPPPNRRASVSPEKFDNAVMTVVRSLYEPVLSIVEQ